MWWAAALNLVRSAFAALWWAFPIILAGIGYVLPAFRVPISETGTMWEGNMQTTFLVGIIISILLAVGWIVVEFFTVSNLGISVKWLRRNSAVSIAIALVLTATVFYLLALESLPWAMMVPWLASVGDSFLSSDRGINNAAQKPLIESTAAGRQRV